MKKKDLLVLVATNSEKLMRQKTNLEVVLGGKQRGGLPDFFGLFSLPYLKGSDLQRHNKRCVVGFTSKKYLNYV